jgi:uncharacterized protein
VTEEGSDEADELWLVAGDLYSSRLTYVETRAAIAGAQRAGRLDAERLSQAKVDLQDRWSTLFVIEVDEDLARVAGDLAERRGLRAGDSVHLASAYGVSDPELVFVTWDVELRRAAEQTGLAVAP